MTEQSNSVQLCEGCGLQLAPAMLACPGCKRLTHTRRLESLASQANAAATAGDVTTSLQFWREALELLPRDSKQFAVISNRISELGLQLPKSAAPTATSTSNLPGGAGVATGLGAIGLLIWKFKVLLIGLTKTTTLFSMLASLGVYWAVWGWKFALGLVLSIYIHEMGHIIQLRRYGFKTGVPTFIPGLGALIRMQQQVVNQRENADIGLAGPIYGLGAALIALGLWQATSMTLFAAIAGVGAWINLFNLLPFGSLDGGRGFQAMSRIQKIIATVCVAIAWYFAQDGMLVLIFIGCIAQLIIAKKNENGYTKATVIYCLLIFVLTAISSVQSLIKDP